MTVPLPANGSTAWYSWATQVHDRTTTPQAPATHTHGVTDLTATGTKSASTFLRGDNTWAVPAGSSGGGEVIAPAPSGGDDYAALVAAMPTAGALRLRAGTYLISGNLTVGAQQDLVGAGGNLTGSATILQCTAAGAGVTFTESGSVSGGFQIDGYEIATAPLKRLLGTGGSQRTFLNLSVAYSAQDNLLISGAQNDLWLGCNSQYSIRDCLVIEDGAGGNAFVRCEFNGAGRYHFRSDDQISGGSPFVYSVPAHNHFFHCLFERKHYSSNTTTSNIYLAASDYLSFTSCVIYAETAATGPRVDIASTGTVTFNNCRIMGDTSASGGGTGIRVINGADLLLTNRTQLFNLQYGINLVSGNPNVEVLGSIGWNNIGTRYTGSGFPDVSVKTAQDQHTAITRDTATDKALAVYVAGEAGVRLLLGADGSVGFNNGVGYTPKATLSSGGQNVLTMPAAQVVQGGRGATGSRPSAATVGAGAQWFDTTLAKPIWSDGTTWRDATGTAV